MEKSATVFYADGTICVPVLLIGQTKSPAIASLFRRQRENFLLKMKNMPVKFSNPFGSFFTPTSPPALLPVSQESNRALPPPTVPTQKKQARSTLEMFSKVFPCIKTGRGVVRERQPAAQSSVRPLPTTESILEECLQAIKSENKDGAGISYIRTLSNDIDESRADAAKEVERFHANAEKAEAKGLMPATCVGIAPFDLFDIERSYGTYNSGFVLGGDTPSLLSYKGDIVTFGLWDPTWEGDFEKAFSVSDKAQMHSAVSELCHSIIINQDVGENLITDPKTAFAKYLEISKRIKGESENISSKYLVIQYLKKYLPENFDENNVRPFSIYKNQLLAKLTPGERKTIAHALTKIDRMPEVTQIEYLKKGMQSPSLSNNYTYEDGNLSHNEHLLLPEPSDIKGIYLNDNNRSHAIILHDAYLKKTGKSLPFYTYDRANSQVLLSGKNIFQLKSESDS